MVDEQGKLEILHEAGDVATQLLPLGFPAPSPDCPTDEDDNPILEDDDRYWAHVDQIETVLQRFGPVERNERYRGINAGVALVVDRTLGGTPFCKFMVLSGLNGEGSITIQFILDRGWHTAIDHSYPSLTQVDIGRYIAKAELSLLANELGSNAETLDYWMCEAVDYHDEEWDQSRWAEARNVSRQTVNQRVRDAKRKLGIE